MIFWSFLWVSLLLFSLHTPVFIPFFMDFNPQKLWVFLLDFNLCMEVHLPLFWRLKRNIFGDKNLCYFFSL